MSDEDSDDRKYHPRLRMISSFDGEVEGSLKFHKSLFQYRNLEYSEEEWSFNRETHGPHDPGFSGLMQSYEDMDLSERDEEFEPYKFRITEEGRRFVKGLRRGLEKLDDSFVGREESMSVISERNKNRTGNEIEEDEDVQEAKENPYQTDV